jgi:hypothetical protein
MKIARRDLDAEAVEPLQMIGDEVYDGRGLAHLAGARLRHLSLDLAAHEEQARVARDEDGLDEVVFAPLYSPIPWDGGFVRSHLHVLTGASGALSPVSSVPVGEAGNDDFPGYGTCGIAIADLPGTPAGKEIVVTTLNGELVVFGQSSGVVNQTPLYRTVVQGSIGAFNSIVIANLEPDTMDKPEVYLPGSYGIRRFDFP